MGDGESSVTLDDEYSSGDDEDYNSSTHDNDGKSLATFNNNSSDNPNVINSTNPQHDPLNDSCHKKPFFVPTGADTASMRLSSRH